MQPNDDMRTPIFVISGGAGHSAEQVVESVLVQFPDAEIPLVLIPHMRRVDQIQRAVARARESGGTIVHTMVDSELRIALMRAADEEGVLEIDLMGGLIHRLTRVLGRQPLGQPGLYRRLRQDYFDRVAAIDYAMAHDDGLSPTGWKHAEIVLIGVSRVGKTPLTMYLAVLGWKVANIPFVASVPPGALLDEVDRRRVIALDIDPTELAMHRHHRQRALGMVNPGDYADAQAICDEVDVARREFRRRGFGHIDVTDKPIETLSDEVIRMIARRLGDDARREQPAR